MSNKLEQLGNKVIKTKKLLSKFIIFFTGYMFFPLLILLSVCRLVSFNSQINCCFTKVTVIKKEAKNLITKNWEIEKDYSVYVKLPFNCNDKVVKVRVSEFDWKRIKVGEKIGVILTDNKGIKLCLSPEKERDKLIVQFLLVVLLSVFPYWLLWKTKRVK